MMIAKMISTAKKRGQEENDDIYGEDYDIYGEENIYYDNDDEIMDKNEM